MKVDVLFELKCLGIISIKFIEHSRALREVYAHWRVKQIKG